MVQFNNEYLTTLKGKDELSPVLKTVTKSVQTTTSAFEKFGIDVPRLMARAAVTIPVWAALRASVLALPNALAAASKEWLSFQTEMSRVATATRGSAQTLKILEDGIVSFTKTTGASFKDAASAVYALGSAGLTASQQLAGLPAVMNLAIGTFGDIEQSAKLVSGIFNVFGKSLTGATTEFEKFQKITNILSYTYAVQQVELDELATALGYVSSVGNIVNVSFEDLTGTIGFLNSSLLKGSKSGTALLNTLLELAQKPGKLRDLGLSIDTSKPISFFTRGGDETGIMNQLNKLFGESVLSMNNLNKLMEIFGNRGGKAVAVILTSWQRFKKALDETNDPKAMENFAEALRLQAEDNIPAQFQKMSNKVTAIFFGMFDQLETPLKGFIKDINDALSRFDSMEKVRKQLGEKTRTESAIQGLGGVAAGAALFGLARPLGGALGARAGSFIGRGAASSARGVLGLQGILESARNQQQAQLFLQTQVFKGINLASTTKNLARMRALDPTAATAYGLFQQQGGRGLAASVARGNVAAVKNLFPVQSLATLFSRELGKQLPATIVSSIGKGLTNNLFRAQKTAVRAGQFLVGEQLGAFRQRSFIGQATQLGGNLLGKGFQGLAILNIINGLAQAIAPDSKLATYLNNITTFINTTLINVIEKVITYLEMGVRKVNEQLIAPILTQEGQTGALKGIGAVFDILRGNIPAALEKLQFAQKSYADAVKASTDNIEKANEAEKRKAELAKIIASQAPGNERALLYLKGLTEGNPALEKYRAQIAANSEIQQSLLLGREGGTNLGLGVGRRAQFGPGTTLNNFLSSFEKSLSALPKKAIDSLDKDQLAARIAPQLEKYAASFTDAELAAQGLVELRTKEGRLILANTAALDIMSKLTGAITEGNNVNLDIQKQILEQNNKHNIALKQQAGEYTAIQAVQAELAAMVASYNLGKAPEEILNINQMMAMTDQELLRYLSARLGDEKQILAIREKILNTTIKEQEEILKTGKVIKDLFSSTFADLFKGNIGFKDFGKAIADGFNNALADEFGDIVGGGLTDVLGLDVGFGRMFTNLRNTMSGPIGKIKNAHLEGVLKAVPYIEQAHMNGMAKAASGVNTGDAMGGGGVLGTLVGGIGQILPAVGQWLTSPAYWTTQKVNQSIWAPGTTQSVQREVAKPGLTGGQLLGGLATSALAGFSGYQAAGGGGWGALRGSLAGIGTGLMTFGGPAGLIAGGLMTLGSMFIKGQQDPGQPENTTSTENFSVTSRIDVTNKQLMMVNRNLVALRQTMEYILPESSYFSEKTILEDNFSISSARGMA